MKRIAKIFAMSLVTLLAVTAIAQTAAGQNARPVPDPSVNMRLERLERLMQAPPTQAAPKEAAESPEVVTTIRTGTLVYNFTIELSTPIVSGTGVYCSVSVQVSDAGTGSYFDDSGEADASISGSTAHCTVKIPYSWNLATSSVGTDMVTGYYDVSEYTGVSGAGMTERNNSHGLIPINVPANGATTSSGFLPRL